MQIIQKHGYYYLQYVFKADSRIISKEKYLGREIPKNIEEIKAGFLKKIQGQTLFKKFDKIKEGYQKEWKHYPESIKKKIKEELTISFTYNTNRIEGSTLTLEETNDLIRGRIAPHKPLADIQEAQHHARVFSGILENKYEELSWEVVKNWHLEIFRESKPDIAGKVRDYLVRAGDYRAPDWQDVPKLLEEFFVWYHKSKKEMHAVELAGKAHYKFVKIHPFGDGNGRICRLIQNFILHKYGYPMLIIEYTKRKSYYKALNKADLKKSDWEFMKYFYRRYLRAHREYL